MEDLISAALPTVLGIVVALLAAPFRHRLLKEMRELTDLLKFVEDKETRDYLVDERRDLARRLHNGMPAIKALPIALLFGVILILAGIAALILVDASGWKEGVKQAVDIALSDLLVTVVVALVTFTLIVLIGTAIRHFRAHISSKSGGKLPPSEDEADKPPAAKPERSE